MRGKIFGGGKYLVVGGKEQGEGKRGKFWRRKIFGPENWRRKKEENIWKRKIFGPRGRRRKEKEKEENI